MIKIQPFYLNILFTDNDEEKNSLNIESFLVDSPNNKVIKK